MAGVVANRNGTTPDRACGGRAAHADRQPRHYLKGVLGDLWVYNARRGESRALASATPAAREIPISII